VYIRESPREASGCMRCDLRLLVAALGVVWGSAACDAASETTLQCLVCHETVTPGVFHDWTASRHAKRALAEVLAEPEPSRRFGRLSATDVPESLRAASVGCAECHTLNPEKHADTFDHNGFKVHTVVTPDDCATCHPVEREEYARNLMSHAKTNLEANPVYHSLADAANGPQRLEGGRLVQDRPSAMTEADSCFACHGTTVGVEGTRSRNTELGEMDFPVLTGWPNQGVGRVNPDGSAGACTACHTRHRFSMAVARQPYTCSQCHQGPDVPAYKVYMASKHGNLYASHGNTDDYDALPWVPGRHISTPTCAVCHASMLSSPDGRVLSERTHAYSDRLPWRLMGLPYAHAHPKSPDTTIIRNQAGLPLATELTGEPASEFLIGPEEQAVRLGRMRQVCLNCHAGGWVGGHFAKLDHAIETTNQSTLTATQLLLQAWDSGLANGLAAGASVFDDEIERMWVEHWLFYANSTRLAAAMAGADYGVFADGRWQLSRNIEAMHQWVDRRQRPTGGQ